jgi:hypothetical protein
MKKIAVILSLLISTSMTHASQGVFINPVNHVEDATLSWTIPKFHNTAGDNIRFLITSTYNTASRVVVTIDPTSNPAILYCTENSTIQMNPNPVGNNQSASCLVTSSKPAYITPDPYFKSGARGTIRIHSVKNK